jgi:hypothetical protein
MRVAFVNRSGALFSTTWELNDFGRWGWNLLHHGRRTPYFIHTTSDDEAFAKAGRAIDLVNSHGCVHVIPAERNRMISAGYLKQGMDFEVRPYSESGPP